jgi:hypothetical protein
MAQNQQTKIPRCPTPASPLYMINSKPSCEILVKISPVQEEREHNTKFALIPVDNLN